MKKGFQITLALVLILALAACGSSAPAQNPSSQNLAPETELIVFAAASLSGVLAEIAGTYSEANPNMNLVFNFDSSGTLRTQIQEGAQADLFISAAQREMDQLEGQGFLLDGTRLNLLENQVVLVVAPGNPGGIESFSDMAEALVAGDVLMAMGNMDVPAGRYAQEILNYFGLDHSELAGTGVISYGSNVREVALQVREASVDMGIVYLTDAVDHGLTVVGYATADMSGRVILPAAVLNESRNSEAARFFLEFLAGDEAMEIFSAWGFTPYV
ncbi:MAG: molybdate ABC transporter substrate-binding protein [Oscillospiraceae bacterium]|nr:molybdate ABC transporter substrate-binding protein [Oscillospiraceae bacterium]